jgi:ABC-type branched-subunit amino acid transport system ATPase component
MGSANRVVEDEPENPRGFGSVTDNSDRLETRSVRVHFEGVKAVDDVDLVLDRGEILGLIGPNGAGKTTLVNVLSGFQPVLAGTVWLSGVNVTGWAPHRLARSGLARTFQNLRLFNNLTVLENVEVGAVANGFSRKEARRQASELLELLRLSDKTTERASALPQGEERRVGIARALATRPAFILLDEPAAGLNEAETRELMTMIAAFRDRLSCGVLVIEHDMRVIMGLSERIQVLDYGKTISVGDPTDVRKDPAVIKSYLGTRKDRKRAQD